MKPTGLTATSTSRITRNAEAIAQFQIVIKPIVVAHSAPGAAHNAEIIRPDVFPMTGQRSSIRLVSIGEKLNRLVPAVKLISP